MMKKIIMREKLKISFTFVMGIFFITMFSINTFADWVKEGNKYKYFNTATGTYVVNNWLQTGNGYYYLDANGYTVQGWYNINGKYYYFNQDGLMQTGFQELGGKTYYLDTASGQMVTGWVQTYVNGVVDYYYFDVDGTMVTGWKQIQGKWYYFYEGKALVDTFAKINDVWYHFNTKGEMDTGWVSVNGKMYYMNVSNGSLMKGWIQDQYGNEYYLSENDGSLAVNCTLQIQGRYFTFDETGKCVAKDQYSTIGTQAGNNSGLITGAIANKGDEVVYGVNVGISPGSNTIQGVQSSYQYQQQAGTSLQPGTTTGPK